MYKFKYSILAFVISFVFWFFDASVHYYIYNEPQFEFVPEDFNELWMRTTIILLLILFGIYADFSIRRLLIKEKQLEAARIYDSMMHASQHILNNLLNQMLLFKIEAMKSKDFDKEIIKLYDNAIDEASALIQSLSKVANITDENIWAYVSPANPANLSTPSDNNNHAEKNTHTIEK